MSQFVCSQISKYKLIRNIFLIPSSLSGEIEKKMNSFGWGYKGSQNKGIFWDKLSMHKNDIWMGFKNLMALNLAMLGKQG